MAPEHSISVGALKVTSEFDERSMARIVRVVAYRFTCSCGARGSGRPTWREAQEDAARHQLGRNS